MRPRPGDVIEIETSKGLAYAQYTRKDHLYGALLRVLPGLFQHQPNDWESLVSQPEMFFTFFPLGAAVHRGIVKIVARLPLSESAQAMPLMRAAGRWDKTGRIVEWWLWDGEREWRVGELTPEQRNLSIREIVNDTLLIERIASGWKPSDDA